MSSVRSRQEKNARRRECGRKVAHETVEAAQAVIDRVGVDPTTVGIYRCRWCGLIHWGKLPTKHKPNPDA